jgi:hypothetical protein
MIGIPALLSSPIEDRKENSQKFYAASKSYSRKGVEKNARVMYSVSTAFNCECLAGTIEQFD